VEKPASIRIILAARDHDRSLKELLAAKDSTSLIAARGASAAEVTELRKWLKETGRL
jgi:ribosomal protein L10